MKRTSLLALVSFAALAAGTASAQTYDRIITFGDSLSDNGNLYALSGGTQPPAPYNQRFTNDKVWVEYLVGTMKGYPTTGALTGNVNFAFGGARTDTQTSPPGTAVQLQAYQARGGTFGSRDVVSLWAGANNLFQGLPTAALNPSTAIGYMTTVANSAAADISAQVNTIAGAGAGTILVFNLPDLNNTPQFKGTTAQDLAGFSGSTFNSALNTAMKTVAAARPDANIVQVDINTAFKLIIANPSAFGLSDVTSNCVATTACVTGGAAVQNTYLFWDGVHPTAAGHKLVAQVAAQYLYTPTLSEGAGMFADISYAVRRNAMLAFNNRLYGGPEGVFVEVIGDQAQAERTVSLQAAPGATAVGLNTKAYDYDVTGLRFGTVFTHGDHVRAGAGVTLLKGDAEGYLITAKPMAISLDAGLNWSRGAHFVTLGAGIGYEEFEDYRRHTTLSAIVIEQEKVQGWSASAHAEAGLRHDLGGVELTPVARLSWVSGHMRGFDENYTVGAVGFDGRGVSALSGAVELRGAAQMGEKTRLTGSVGYEGVLSETNDAVKGRLINNIALPFSRDMGDRPSEGVIASVGFETEVAGFTLSARYAGSFGDEGHKSQSGLIALSKAF
ncbi:MAG: SGNH/GDSL hydrolase family protein [Asticcacaulis sp.]